MAKRTYTDEQLSAIRTRDKTLLVSAAAGAGKTATLTERIICSLIGKDTPDDKTDINSPSKKVEEINKMLIVTFTNKAVDELRERIGAALKNAVAECYTGPYLEDLSKSITEDILRIPEGDKDALREELWHILHGCPSKSIAEEIVSEAVKLCEAHAGKELSLGIERMITEKAKGCNPTAIIPSLENQLYLLPGARISTIDSFCNDILKNNAERCGVPPRYRIADPIEAKVLEHNVWTERIDAAFEGLIPEIATPEEFEQLAASLTGVRSDSALEESFEMLYEKSKSCEDGVKIFTRMRERLEESLEKPIEEISYVRYAMDQAREIADYHTRVITDIMAELCGSPLGIEDAIKNIKAREERIGEIEATERGKKKAEMIDAVGKPDYSEKFLILMSDDKRIAESIRTAKTYGEMKRALSSELRSVNSVGRGEKTPETVRYQSFRKSYVKPEIVGCYNKYFVYTEEDWYQHIKELAHLVGIIERFIQSFDEIFFKEKTRRAMLEYSDIERKCCEVLYNADNTPSDVALALREQFSSIYIDEYQDVNALQNKIFLAISKENNRFTVGDIKQSIYGFRSAKPDIFRKMKEDLPKLSESGDSNGASIFMSKNFRCDRTIINFVNDIFDEMFTMTADALAYTSDDKLVFAKVYGDGEAPSDIQPEVMLFSKSAKKTEVDESEDEDLAEETESSGMSPLWVAKKIKELLASARLNNGKKVEPKHIAILLRKDNGRSIVYKEALENEGIAVSAPDNKSFFLNREIQLALCLLNSINNPLKDIYLAGLMLSPLYRFTPSEIYRARRMEATSLWYSVKRYAEESKEEKFVRFVNDLTRYRKISEGMKVDVLIQRLYNETGLLALGLGSGCKENLMLLYNYARKFEASSYEGLYSFINYVNTVIDTGAAFVSKKEESDTNAVTVITAHKSKGLEYPIVFLADAASSLVSRNESNAKIGYSEEDGIGFKTRMEGGLALVESPIRNAIISRNIEKSIEEELRVYYVALTRARERLYIVGSPPTKSKDDYIANAEIRKKYKSQHLLRQVKTFVDILYSVDTSATITWAEEEAPETTEEFDTYATEQSDSAEKSACSSKEREEKTSTLTPADTEGKEVLTKEVSEDISELLKERFSYKYPEMHLTYLPEKMSISRLSPNVLDGADEVPFDENEEELAGTKFDTEDSSEKKRRTLGRLPDFYSGKENGESAKRGIATHNVLQFMDLLRFGKEGAEKEVANLVADGFISEKDAGLVEISEIERFADSDLYKNMLNTIRSGQRIFREFRFSVMLPAPLFATKESAKEKFKNEEILLQGVIDCIYEDSDGELHLIDYKTDRLTKSELADVTLAKEKLNRAHKLQLTYYAIAIRKMLGKMPKTVRVYSLPLGDTVDIELGHEAVEFLSYGQNG